MNSESTNKFICALVKSLQNLCEGYVEFNNGIELIGHLYLNVDSGSSIDYILKEKICRNSENSAVFVSKSYASQTPSDDGVQGNRRGKLHPGDEEFSNQEISANSGRPQSSAPNLGGALQEDKLRHIDHSHLRRTPGSLKRKRDNMSTYMQPPYKYPHQTSTVSSPYFSESKSTDRTHHPGQVSAHSDFFEGDSNQSSGGLGPDEEDDLNLDVTFVKTESSDRMSHQRGHHHNLQQRLSQDMSSHSELHDPIGGPSGDNPSHLGGFGDLAGLAQFPDMSQSQMDLGQQPGPPNARNPVASSISDDAKQAWAPHYDQQPRPTDQTASPAKTYLCPLCGLHISHRKNIARHMRKHTGEMFLCDLCEWRGTCRWKLHKHREKKHLILSPASEHKKLCENSRQLKNNLKQSEGQKIVHNSSAMDIRNGQRHELSMQSNSLEYRSVQRRLEGDNEMRNPIMNSSTSQHAQTFSIAVSSSHGGEEIKTQAINTIPFTKEVQILTHAELTSERNQMLPQTSLGQQQTFPQIVVGENNMRIIPSSVVDNQNLIRSQSSSGVLQMIPSTMLGDRRLQEYLFEHKQMSEADDRSGLATLTGGAFVPVTESDS